MLAALACVLRTWAAAAQAVGPEFRVNSYTTGIQRNPRIASGPGGGFVVVWNSDNQDGAASGVFGQRYGSTGAPLGAEFEVNTYTTNSQSYPAVASDAGGGFVVVWLGNGEDGSSFGVFGQRYGGTGAPLGAEFLVNTFTPDAQVFPSVASGSDGSFVVVWQSKNQDAPGPGIFAQRYGSTGAPLGAEFQVNTYTTGYQDFPSVASDPGGSFVVVWNSDNQDASSSGVFGQRYGSTGAPLGAEFRVSAYTTNSQYQPAVESTTGGGFVVVWQSFTQDGSLDGVFGKRYGSTGAPLGAEFLVNAYTTGRQNYPAVTSDPDGSFVVIWQSENQDGASYGIFGQRYGSTGAPLGAEFHVNTYTTDNQTYASVASDTGGGFVVVWHGYSQDGSFRGVFGQRFCPALASVTVIVDGTTAVCTTSTGGTATVTDDGGGLRIHQWGYRATPGGATSTIPGETGTSYLITGADFPPTGGFYYLVCATFPECGAATFSNEVLMVVNPDTTAATVTPPATVTTTQTICQ